MDGVLQWIAEHEPVLSYGNLSVAGKWFVIMYYVRYFLICCTRGAKLQATNRVPRPVDRGTATRYGG